MTGEPPWEPNISVIFVRALVVPETTSTNWTRDQLQNPNIRIITNCSQCTSNSLAIKCITTSRRLVSYLHGLSDKLQNICTDTNESQQNLRELITGNTRRFWQHPTTQDNDEQNELMKYIDPVTIRLEKWNFVGNLKRQVCLNIIIISL